MTKKNSASLSLWSTLIQEVKKYFYLFQAYSRGFTGINPQLTQFFQITIVYSLAYIDLIYAIFGTILSFGYIPAIIQPIYGFLEGNMGSAIFRAWSSPERIFFISYLGIEFTVIHPIFNFSKLTKYNIVLIFTLLMIQAIIISGCELFFNREIISIIASGDFNDEILLPVDKMFGLFVFLFVFVLFSCLYFILYIRAIFGKFVTSPLWLADSVAFWLKIKTPTLKNFGKKKE
jgi:hypothetical protein